MPDIKQGGDKLTGGGCELWSLELCFVIFDWKCESVSVWMCGGGCEVWTLELCFVIFESLAQLWQHLLRWELQRSIIGISAHTFKAGFFGKRQVKLKHRWIFDLKLRIVLVSSMRVFKDVSLVCNILICYVWYCKCFNLQAKVKYIWHFRAKVRWLDALFTNQLHCGMM